MKPFIRFKKLTRHRLLKIFQKYFSRRQGTQFSATGKLSSRFPFTTTQKSFATATLQPSLDESFPMVRNMMVDTNENKTRSRPGMNGDENWRIGDSEEGAETFGEVLYLEEGGHPSLATDGCMEDGSLTEWLEVSKSLVFNLEPETGCFHTKIALKNLSKAFYVTYEILQTEPKQFKITHPIGFLPPGHQDVTNVFASKPASKQNFGELVFDSGFTILATPVFFDSQMNLEKLKVLWKAYGSNLFPRDSAEVYFIDTLIPAKEEFLGDYNICELTVVGNQASRKSFPKDFPYPGVTQVNGLSVIKELDFARSWYPTEDEKQMKSVVKYQLRQLARCTKILKQDVESQAYGYRLVFATCLFVGLASFIASVCPNVDYFFNINPTDVQLPVPNPPPKGWFWW